MLPFKTVVLALLEYPASAGRAVRVGTHPPAVQTVSHQVHFLRALAEWTAGRGLTRLSELTNRHLDDYRDHVLALTCPALRKRQLLNAVVLLHAYRDRLPEPCRLATAAPWNGASGDNLVTLPPIQKVNKTPRIAPATMEALLAWPLRMLEEHPQLIVAFRDDLDPAKGGTSDMCLRGVVAQVPVWLVSGDDPRVGRWLSLDFIPGKRADRVERELGVRPPLPGLFEPPGGVEDSGAAG